MFATFHQMQESLSSPIYNMAVQKANCCGQPLIAIILWFTTVLVNFSSAMIHFWRNILEIGGHYLDFQISWGISNQQCISTNSSLCFISCALCTLYKILWKQNNIPNDIYMYVVVDVVMDVVVYVVGDDEWASTVDSI